MSEALSIRAVGPPTTTIAARLLCAMVVAGLGLAGCTGTEPVPPGIAKGVATVAPGISFALLSPASLGRSVEASQLITARFRQDTFAFETRISVTPARLFVVGTDMLGRRAMTIEWSGGELKSEAASWMPSELRAPNVIADIMLLHWPQDAVRAGLMPGGAMRGSGPEHRVIAIDGHDMIRIDRTAGTRGSWSGRWTYRNAGWGYGLDIQSSELGP